MWGTRQKLLRVHESWHVRPLISATRTLQYTQSPADTKMWTSQPQNKMVNKGKLITYPHRQYWGKNLITLYTWWCLLDTSRRCHHANAQLRQAWTAVATEVWAAYPPNFRPLPELDLIHRTSEQRNVFSMRTTPPMIRDNTPDWSSDKPLNKIWIWWQFYQIWNWGQLIWSGKVLFYFPNSYLTFFNSVHFQWSEFINLRLHLRYSTFNSKLQLYFNLKLSVQFQISALNWNSRFQLLPSMSNFNHNFKH